MEFRILIAFTVLLLLGVNSCVKDVKIDLPQYEQKLVIDGRIETGQPPLIILSKTQDLYSETSLEAFLNGFQSGAIVTVSDGTTTVQLDEICTDNLPPGTEEIAAELFGVPVSELANYDLCAYTTFNTAIFGQVGKTYTLTVQFEGKTYTSETKIEQPVPLNNVFWKQEPNEAPGNGFSWAELSDPANQFDAYFWSVRRINLVNGEPKDANFTPTYAPTFDDQFINGTTFEFAFENPMAWGDTSLTSEQKPYYQLNDTVVIKFSKLDPDVYEFLEKKYYQMQNQGNPFASPVAIKTNIKGGALGVWAGYSPSFDTLICAP